MLDRKTARVNGGRNLRGGIRRKRIERHRRQRTRELENRAKELREDAIALERSTRSETTTRKRIERHRRQRTRELENRAKELRDEARDLERREAETRQREDETEKYYGGKYYRATKASRETAFEFRHEMETLRVEDWTSSYMRNTKRVCV